MNKSHEPIVDRKTELEKKRAKLEEIRKRKIERSNVLIVFYFERMEKTIK
jgi:hypothetical protein